MASVEQTGKNIDEATRLALEKLGVIEDQVDVEILEEGSKGFLGIGQTPARVRVTVKMVQPAPKAEPSATKPRQRQRPSPRPRPKSKPEAKNVQETKPTIEQKPVAEERTPISEEVLRQAADSARELLQHILDGIGAGGSVSVKSVSEGQIAMDVDSGDAAILIGKHGQTIDAIQYLVSVITHKKTGAKVRVVIDVGGYRTRREEALKNQAIYLASKVKESGQEAVLDSLHASERRIIHATLADDPDVYTYSEGLEPARHIVISPKK